ncbi:hypothetical protein [Nonomuraea africana]|uniref:Outer membrane biosynthesis protein TonB n=1 Tax=Nonomuraea africana TaxID=46171 RepID=A0ABR9KK25_9ACTN|nr:hypothetical protein [Nonomuraea africana]MBE1562368.1 outer membrane biosynthesis protein TonB [Nonomuraea africana]
MTLPPDEHGDILRRVLRAEADAVVPSPEGLEIIRARIERRGLRGLFWLRAGAAAAGAVLVAGTIVMVVPELRNRVMDVQPVTPIDDTSSLLPDKSATSRPPTSPPPTEQQTRPAVPPPPVSVPPTKETSETHAPTRKAKPTPTPTPCASESAQPPEECLDGTPTPTPSATPSERAENPDNPDCGADQCSPEDPVPTPTDIASPLSSP